jgi:hypothetical protein
VGDVLANVDANVALYCGRGASGRQCRYQYCSVNRKLLVKAAWERGAGCWGETGKPFSLLVSPKGLSAEPSSAACKPRCSSAFLGKTFHPYPNSIDVVIVPPLTCEQDDLGPLSQSS